MARKRRVRVNFWVNLSEEDALFAHRYAAANGYFGTRDLLNALVFAELTKLQDDIERSREVDEDLIVVEDPGGGAHLVGAETDESDDDIPF